MWSSTTGRNLLKLAGHADRVTAVAFSPDGQRLATASEDGTARVWDTASGREMLSLAPGAGRLDAVAFSPDGRLLAVSGADGLAQIRDAVSGAVRVALRGLQYEITEWHLIRLASASSRWGKTQSRECGTQPPAKSCDVWKAIRAGFAEWRSAPTARTSPRQAMTMAPESGMWHPEDRWSCPGTRWKFTGLR